MARAVEGHSIGKHLSRKALTEVVKKRQKEAAGIFQLEELQNRDQILDIV